MAVTQKFIAEQAGVTPKTVSLFMQNSPLVAEKTRAKIRAVMEQHSYFPNYAAMSVRKKQFKRIAFIYTPDFKDPETRSPAPHFIAYINGAALELAKYGYSLFLLGIGGWNHRSAGDLHSFQRRCDDSRYGQACRLDQPPIG